MVMLYKFILPNGHELFTDSDYRHGVIKSPFGCSKVTLIDEGEKIEIGEQLPGIFSPEDCMEWLGDPMPS